MTTESTIYDLLKGLVGNRVFPDVAPPATARPYITYQQVGGQAVAFMERGVPSKKHGRYQVNVWATTRAEAAALALQVEGVFLVTAALQAEALGAPIAAYEPDEGLYGSMQDFSIWSDR